MKFFTAILIIFTTFLACEKASLYKISDTESRELALNSNNEDSYLVSEENKNSIAFIAGFDEDENAYYSNATAHFRNQNIPVVEGLYSLAEIITHLNSANKTFKKIHIISHSNPWAGMSLKTRNDGERITVHNLETEIKSQRIPKIKSGINKDTQILFHSCGLGENTPLALLLKQAFTGTVSPQIIASPYFNVYGGKYVQHYLAKPYYISYPTAHSPGPLALSHEIAAKYPEVSMDWKTALTTRAETTPTAIYSYRFNVPVEWEITFDSSSDLTSKARQAGMPKLETRDDIMDFVSEQDEMALALYKIGIPIEKYRWMVKTNEENQSILIKGKSTVLCVLKPIENSNDPGNYASPDITNKNLYNVF